MKRILLRSSCGAMLAHASLALAISRPEPGAATAEVAPAGGGPPVRLLVIVGLALAAVGAAVWRHRRGSGR